MTKRGLVFHDHDGEGDVFAVGKTERDGCHTELEGALGCATGQLEGGLAAGLAHDLQFEPTASLAAKRAAKLSAAFFLRRQ